MQARRSLEPETKATTSHSADSCPRGGGSAAPSAAPKPVQLQTQIQTQTQVPAGTVLRHVENRRVMTAEEAERKMDEIVRDLFRCESMSVSG